MTLPPDTRPDFPSTLSSLRPNRPLLSWLSDAWHRLRDRLIASARFQRFAARVPLLSLVARRRAAALFDLCAGFVYSQVLLAVVRLRLLETLAEGPRGERDLAERLRLPPDGARRLLEAAAALGLVERRRGERWGLGLDGAALLGNGGALAMVEHHALLYRDLADPVALLRGEAGPTELSRFWSYSAGAASPKAEGEVEGYSALMTRSLPLLVEDLLEAWPFDRHRHLLDVGGGEGALLAALASRFPSLRLSLFELPPVAARARAHLARLGLGDRVQVHAGDLFAAPLPSGADLLSLVRVIHDHDDARALEILAAARRALAPGGVLLVAEPMAGTDGAEAMGAAYFGFYLLAMGQGRPRTESELRRLLAAAGFTSIRAEKTRRPLLIRLLSARIDTRASIQVDT